jgi:hypothetical protein
MNTMGNKLINTVIRVQVHFKNNRKLNAKHSFEHGGTRGKNPKSGDGDNSTGFMNP